jgi:tRNA U34 5-methylaminomethyl-2-thiouridine-forming methyltransferase MnmC
MFDMLYANGTLVTYSSKGIVRRAMQAAGFTVEKLKGPIGKREIVRAMKI